MKQRGVYGLLMMTYAEDYDIMAFYGRNEITLFRMYELL
jgi:hypothetical protein